MIGIYCIEQKSTNRKYIGSSTNIEKRLIQHFSDLLNNRHHNTFLQRAYNKYGINDFETSRIEIFESINNDELLLIEQLYISDNSGGFNMAPAKGGDTLSNHPNKKEIIEKRKITSKYSLSLLTEDERKQKYGNPRDKNGRWDLNRTSWKLCPTCNINKIWSNNISCGKCRIRTGNKNPFYGKKHSTETKQKISKKNKGNTWTIGLMPEEMSYTKQYKITNLLTSEIEFIFGLKTIAEKFNCSIANVALTIDRMKNNIIPKKKSRFYQYKIEIVEKDTN